MGVPKGMFPITPGAALAQRAYGLRFTGAGTVVFDDGDGDEVTVVVVDGETVWSEVTAVASFSGTSVHGYKRPSDW